MPPTIRAVARHARVSVATVSYVLNNRPGVTEETRQRVLQTIRQLDYHPSSAARNLVRHHAATICMLLPDRRGLADPFLTELICGLGDGAAERGFSLLLTPTDDRPLGWPVRERRADGLILMDVVVGDQRVRLLRSRDVPFILFGRCLEDPTVSFVDLDTVDAAHQAVSHLTALGHRRIGFIAPPLHYVYAQGRLEGYRKALAEQAIAFDPALVVEAAPTVEGGAWAAGQLLDQPGPPTALFASSDLTAAGALRTARERGLRVPDDLSVVGFDDTKVAELADPPLTTVRQPTYDLGRHTARGLIDILLGHGEPPHLLLRGELVVRRSTARAPIYPAAR